MEKQKRDKLLLQDIYFYSALIFTVIGFVVLFIAILGTGGTIPPGLISVEGGQFFRGIYLYQVAHGLLGILLLIIFMIQRRNGQHNVRLIKTPIAIVVSFVNFVIYLAALIVLAAYVSM